ncbi:Carbonic anhydrase [Hondaea fermentalgiana]|uniref:carbonic anhydrase n=1 Tax=Hondaea fermentalgiana TaxID=2315210 RepID=A0A2R5G9Z5_9STRA|nr:Carbonic anhydrase [Hondaea fermentalgiana]|eukprot:GBG27837.1 Carbonic anhydrase [Hondaea fermentalgiana]
MIKSVALVVAAALVGSSEACGTDYVRELKDYVASDAHRELRGDVLSGTYCDLTEQSPINLPALDSVVGLNPVQDIPAIEIEYAETDAESKMILENLGGTIEVVPEHTDIFIKNNSIAQMIGRGSDSGDTYQVAQFHFHWDSNFTGYGSEHYRGNAAYPIEMHIVTFNTKYDNISNALAQDDGLLVIGIFGSTSETPNSEFDKIVTAIEDSDSFIEDDHVDLEEFSLEDMIAEIDLSKFDSYKGSLTTPNCNQVVSWVVMHDTLELSEEQIEVFQQAHKSETELIAPNYRELQDLNGRTIYRSQSAPSPAAATRFSPVAVVLGLFAAVLARPL